MSTCHMVAGWLFVPGVGLAFVGWGYYALVKWIPNSRSDVTRTDIHSARVSCHVIGAGVLIVILWAISALTILTFGMLRALCVI